MPVRHMNPVSTYPAGDEGMRGDGLMIVMEVTAYTADIAYSVRDERGLG